MEMEQQQPPSSSSATPSSSPSSSQRRELQGPRPPPLKVHKDSHKIRKPPLPQQMRQPVIIYTVSPKVVHAEPSEFMSVVQRLTGARRPTTASAASCSSSALPAPAPLQHQITSSSLLPFPFFGGHHHHADQAPPPSSALLPPHPQAVLHFPFPMLHHQEAARAPPPQVQLGLQLSPAARLAAIERGSSARSSGDVGGGLPQPSPSSILSPGSLPAIPPNFFSPAPAGHTRADSGGGINLLGGALISPAAFLGGAATTAGAGGSITTAASAGASQNIVMLPEEASPSAPSPSGAYCWDLFNNRHY